MGLLLLYLQISKDTTDIFVEVTSSTNLEVCKTAMDELLLKMLQMGCGSKQGEATANDTATSSGRLSLLVEQVKILDVEGHMKVVYPSRADLSHPGIEVVRDYDQ